MSGNQGSTANSNGRVAFSVSGAQFGFRPLEMHQPLLPKAQKSVVPTATPRRGQAWGMAAYISRQP